MMQKNPDPAPNPSIRPGAVGAEPMSGVPSDVGFDSRRQLQLKLVTDMVSEGSSTLWFASYLKGTKSPMALADQIAAKDFINVLSRTGLQETEPVLMACGGDQGTYRLLLFPKDQFINAEHVALDRLIGQISGLQAEALGIYFCPEMFGSATALRLTSALANRLILLPSLDSIFFLQGAHGYNQVLNLMYGLKSSSEDKSLLLTVFH